MDLNLRNMLGSLVLDAEVHEVFNRAKVRLSENSVSCLFIMGEVKANITPNQRIEALKSKIRNPTSKFFEAESGADARRQQFDSPIMSFLIGWTPI